jgi:hypothetical protein
MVIMAFRSALTKTPKFAQQAKPVTSNQITSRHCETLICIKDAIERGA